MNKKIPGISTDIIQHSPISVLSNRNNVEHLEVAVVSVAWESLHEHVSWVGVPLNKVNMQVTILDQLLDVMLMDTDMLDLVMGMCIGCQCNSALVVAIENARAWLGKRHFIHP